MKNPQKQFIFTCFPTILRSRPHARFPLPAAYFFRDRFCRYGALPSCRSSRRTYFSRPYAFVFPAINRPPQRRFREADIRGRTDDSRIKQESHRQQPSFYLSASYAAPRRFSPPAASNSASKKHIKKNRSGETLLRNDSEIKNSTYFFAAATCFATSSLRSSLFFSKPSPIT